MSLQERNWVMLITSQGHFAGFGATRDEALANALRLRQREAAWIGVENDEERAALAAEDDEWASTLIEGMARWLAVFPDVAVKPDDRPIELLPVLLTRGTEIEICRMCGCTEREPCEPPCSWVDADLCSACVELDDEVVF